MIITESCLGTAARLGDVGGGSEGFSELQIFGALFPPLLDPCAGSIPRSNQDLELQRGEC